MRGKWQLMMKKRTSKGTESFSYYIRDTNSAMAMAQEYKKQGYEVVAVWRAGRR